MPIPKGVKCKAHNGKIENHIQICMEIQHISTQEPTSIQPFLQDLYIPPKTSHKGQNGKVLVIGGSLLFHSASLWSAEVASYFVDMVHFASTQENNKIFTTLKTQFRDGIVVHRKDLPQYIDEDDAILIGPGLLRTDTKPEIRNRHLDDILKIENEGELSRELTYFVLNQFPNKQFVVDAGALQMMDAQWLTLLQKPAVITPHVREFEKLFSIKLNALDENERVEKAVQVAKQYSCIVMLKSVQDIITDGIQSFVVTGGNQGLAKGGTGDVLSGLVVSLVAKNNPLHSAVLASYVEKKTAEDLFEQKGYWYNVSELVKTIPKTFFKLVQYRLCI